MSEKERSWEARHFRTLEEKDDTINFSGDETISEVAYQVVACPTTNLQSLLCDLLQQMLQMQKFMLETYQQQLEKEESYLAEQRELLC